MYCAAQILCQWSFLMNSQLLLLRLTAFVLPPLSGLTPFLSHLKIDAPSTLTCPPTTATTSKYAKSVHVGLWCQHAPGGVWRDCTAHKNRPRPQHNTPSPHLTTQTSHNKHLPAPPTLLATTTSSSSSFLQRLACQSIIITWLILLLSLSLSLTLSPFLLPLH